MTITIKVSDRTRSEMRRGREVVLAGVVENELAFGYPTLNFNVQAIGGTLLVRVLKGGLKIFEVQEPCDVCPSETLRAQLMLIA